MEKARRREVRRALSPSALSPKTGKAQAYARERFPGRAGRIQTAFCAA